MPGALARYRRNERLRSDLARRLLAGTLPGVVIGALLRVYLLPGGTVFRVLVALFLAPILVAAGYLVAEVSPAALLSTFLTSCVGAATYAVLELTGRQHAAPNWPVGLARGLGGLVGGYVGASLAPHLPQLVLRRLLGAGALALSVAYLLIALTN